MWISLSNVLARMEQGSPSVSPRWGSTFLWWLNVSSHLELLSAGWGKLSPIMGDWGECLSGLRYLKFYSNQKGHLELCVEPLGWEKEDQFSALVGASLASLPPFVKLGQRWISCEDGTWEAGWAGWCYVFEGSVCRVLNTGQFFFFLLLYGKIIREPRIVVDPLSRPLPCQHIFVFLAVCLHVTHVRARNMYTRFFPKPVEN